MLLTYIQSSPGACKLEAVVNLTISTPKPLVIWPAIWDRGSDSCKSKVEIINMTLSLLGTGAWSAFLAVKVQASGIFVCVFGADSVLLVLQPIRAPHLPDQIHTCNQ